MISGNQSNLLIVSIQNISDGSLQQPYVDCTELPFRVIATSYTTYYFRIESQLGNRWVLISKECRASFGVCYQEFLPEFLSNYQV